MKEDLAMTPLAFESADCQCIGRQLLFPNGPSQLRGYAAPQSSLILQGFGSPYGVLLFNMELELIREPRQILGGWIDPSLPHGHLISTRGTFRSRRIIVHVIGDSEPRLPFRSRTICRQIGIQFESHTLSPSPFHTLAGWMQSSPVRLSVLPVMWGLGRRDSAPRSVAFRDTEISRSGARITKAGQCDQGGQEVVRTYALLANKVRGSQRFRPSSLALHRRWSQ